MMMNALSPALHLCNAELRLSMLEKDKAAEQPGDLSGRQPRYRTSQTPHTLEVRGIKDLPYNFRREFAEDGNLVLVDRDSALYHWKNVAIDVFEQVWVFHMFFADGFHRPICSRHDTATQPVRNRTPSVQ